MNPAFSVIFFTTASGAGYGMLLWLGVLLPLGELPASPWFGVPALVIGLGLATAGLLSSTFHLGHPERAWRAVSQWRTSWLSREGAAALMTYVPAGLLGLIWLIAGVPGAAGAVFGVLAALMAAVTIVCTAMIYVALKPIRQWHNQFVLPMYVLCALYSGAACLAALCVFFLPAASRLLVVAAIVFGAAALVVKLVYWRFIDTSVGTSTAGTATGLSALGRVRLLDAPHTEENYLLREMGFRIGRKHAASLRVIALALGFAAPLIMLLLALAIGGPAMAVLLLLAAAAALVGLLVERWLFFAEATHTVVLYYGRG